jgi:pimeloyl-ACP methyl ester carboxylesterase
MTTILKGLGWLVLALVVLLVGAYLVLRRPDIPFATLEQRYAAPTSHYMDLPDGTHVHYRDEGNPAGPVLVLVHGYSASAADWDGWAKALGDKYRIIAPDLPGHGLTRTPNGYQSGPDAQVAVVDAVATGLALPRFVIAGNSMGGGVAWRYALAHPDRLNGLVLVDAAGWPHETHSKDGALIFKLLSNPIARPIIKNLDDTSLAKQGLEAAFVDKSLVTPALVKRYTDLARAPGHRDILISAQQNDPATAERLAPIHTPTLIMFGQEDHLIPYTDGKQFADAIRGSTLIVYPGVGHVPMEQIPDKSAADLRAWMEAHKVDEKPSIITRALQMIGLAPK